MSGKELWWSSVFGHSTFIASACVLVLMLYRKWRAMPKVYSEKKNYDLQNAMYVLALAVLYSIVSMTALAQFSGAPGSCKMFARLSVSVYMFAKGVLYCIIIQRLYVVYGGTMYAYNDRTLYGMAGVVIVVILVIIGAFVSQMKVETRKFSGGRKSCVNAKPPIPAVIMGVLLDIGVSGACLHMFTKPLSKLMKQSYTDTGNEDFKRIAFKSTILTWTAVITNFMMVLSTVVVGESYLLPPDMFVNVMCIALMSKWFNPYFDTLCACPVWISSKVCGCDDDGANPAMQRIRAATVSVLKNPRRNSKVIDVPSQDKDKDKDNDSDNTSISTL